MATSTLEVSLLNYHLGQVRTGGNMIAAFIALYNWSSWFGGTHRALVRCVSILVFLTAAWMLWHGGSEYRDMVEGARDTIPEDRARSMLAWTALSRGMAGAAACVALFSGIHTALDIPWRGEVTHNKHEVTI